MKSEKRLIERILEKKEPTEKLTESESRMIAYCPYRTAAGASFAPVVVHLDMEGEE